MNIAFFDSGIGGLTVLKSAIALLPYENYIYYADTKNVPYGTKTKEEIKKFIFNAVDFLAGKNIKILVVACNTATSAAINDLRKIYKFPIVGMEPAIKPAIENNLDKKILVLATTFTLKEEKLENLIKSLDKKNKIEKLAMDNLVAYAERFEFNSMEVKSYIKNKLDTVNLEEYETIVLGCTHFIFYKQIIKELIPENIEIIDGNEGTINNMIRILKGNKLLNHEKESNIVFYSSGIPDNEERTKKLAGLLY